MSKVSAVASRESGAARMEDRNVLFGKFRWEIDDYDRCECRYSRVFNLSGCNWKILIEKSIANDYILLYLVVGDCGLPTGWSRDVTFRLTLVNQNYPDCSMTQERRFTFNEEETESGYQFKTFLEQGNGFLVNGSMVVEAEVFVHSSSPRAPEKATESSRFDSYLTNLVEFINAAETSADNEVLIPKEIKEAKKSLKECLEGFFQLNMIEKLSSALSTLSSARTWLLPGQQRSVQTFWDNFDDFISDFIDLEKHKTTYELEKFQKVKLLYSMKKKRETHIEKKQLLDEVTMEEEELKKKLREVKSRKRKLVSEWNALVTESEEVKQRYGDQEVKLQETEVKKWKAQEMVAKSTVAWVNLRAEFL